MKSIHISKKAKKGIVVTSIAVLCVGGIIFAEKQQLNASGMTEDLSSQDTEIVLGTPNSISVPSISSESGTSSAFVPSSGAKASEPLTSVSKPTSTPSKPTSPASSKLTNKNKKPVYSTKPKASTSSKKSTTSKVTKAPKGKSYMPGFGYVDGTGGGETIVGSDVGGDINKQVGIME